MDPLFVSVKYNLIKTVGKHVVLPLFLNSINDITTNIFILKGKEGENNINLKNEIEDSDLEHKMITIASFLREVSDEEYQSPTVHMHLCGIYDVFEKIQNEMTIMKDEYEYSKSSWYYYTIEWIWYKTKVNFQNLKKQIKLLDDRYKMLLSILMIQKAKKI